MKVASRHDSEAASNRSALRCCSHSPIAYIKRMAGPNRKLPCIFAQRSAKKGSTYNPRPACRRSCSAAWRNNNARIQEKTWGRASQCMLVAPNRRTVVAAVKNKLPPNESDNWAAPPAVRAMASAAMSATPGSPAARCEAPNTASDSHSHANHGWPLRVYEKRSVRGTDAELRMASPLRTCHPVSLSWNNLGLPAERNNTWKSVTAKTAAAKFGRNHAAREVTPAGSALERGVESRE